MVPAVVVAMKFAAPPAINIWPLFRSVAVCPERAVVMAPAAVNVLVDPPFLEGCATAEAAPQSRSIKAIFINLRL